METISLGAYFDVHIDHESVKHLREQNIKTSYLQKLLVKLMAYDFTVIYNQGKSNRAVDAHSR